MNKIKKIADETGEPPLLIYQAMKKDGIDFATFPAVTIARLLPFSKILKKDLKKFDDTMKQDVGKGNNFMPADKDWVGINSPKLEQYLSRQDKAGVRKKFVKLMDTAPFQTAGFPDVGIVRYANTQPEFRKLKAGDSGAFIGKPDLSKSPSPSKHSTYNTQIYGDYVGGLLEPVPQEVLWKKFFDNMDKFGSASTGAPLVGSQRNRAFSMKLPSTYIDQEIVDAVSNLGLLRSK